LNQFLNWVAGFGGHLDQGGIDAGDFLPTWLPDIAIFQGLGIDPNPGFGVTDGLQFGKDDAVAILSVTDNEVPPTQYGLDGCPFGSQEMGKLAFFLMTFFHDLF
jgi:hypothetical protein